MRLIDADALKEKILAERDAIPKTYVDRYSFGVEVPNQHGNSMRGGIRKALHCLEQTPTIDPESIRKKGKWKRMAKYENDHICSECGDIWPDYKANFCPNCGADMRGESNA